jgi:hypothetical protein
MTPPTTILASQAARISAANRYEVRKILNLIDRLSFTIRAPNFCAPYFAPGPRRVSASRGKAARSEIKWQ